MASLALAGALGGAAKGLSKFLSEEQAAERATALEALKQTNREAIAERQATSAVELEDRKEQYRLAGDERRQAGAISLEQLKQAGELAKDQVDRAYGGSGSNYRRSEPRYEYVKNEQGEYVYGPDGEPEKRLLGYDALIGRQHEFIPVGDSRAAGAAQAASDSTAPPAGTTQRRAPPPAAIEALRAGKGTPEQFDAIFGPGSAAQYLQPEPMSVDPNAMPLSLNDLKRESVLQ